MYVPTRARVCARSRLHSPHECVISRPIYVNATYIFTIYVCRIYTKGNAHEREREREGNKEKQRKRKREKEKQREKEREREKAC